jgi:hypothetical protein
VGVSCAGLPDRGVRHQLSVVGPPRPERRHLEALGHRAGQVEGPLTRPTSVGSGHADAETRSLSGADRPPRTSSMFPRCPPFPVPSDTDAGCWAACPTSVLPIQGPAGTPVNSPRGPIGLRSPGRSGPDADGAAGTQAKRAAGRVLRGKRAAGRAQTIWSRERRRLMRRHIRAATAARMATLMISPAR